MVRLRGRASERGQGTTELALGLLLFVTVLIFGIHFAEVGYLSLKVQEAATSALWDTTSAKMHELPRNFDPLTNLISSDKPGQLATERYKDFDGRTSKAGGGKVVQLFTSAQQLQVTCGEAANIFFEPSTSTNTRVYRNVGGMTCNAQAQLSPVKKFTRSFLDKGKGAFFDVPHYAAGAIPVCGMGRAQGGKCAGGFGILLDDWALSSRSESGECHLLNCGNTAYYDSAKVVYDKHNQVNGASVTLARSIVGEAPINPAKFWMSFRGRTSNFLESDMPGGDSDTRDWETTPGFNSRTQEYHRAFNRRKTCFLGNECPSAM
ncbi:hypothetical protein ATI61_109265 [Archangium gephyra]|uniref:Pilus biogenesis operon protein n=1 Tax=Archangium gephyra TaxID=48 RepID=A0AAC8TB42_9BACT|nr:pilus assembly protein [Archangium gephyra]AKI99536.1 putative pilus biogenesis operon protein [Archangium gephyra]REG27924.1 hypothetical protein ATI61_109265 [Archangium gephyra]